jgi:ribosomal protein L37AE/L43A
MKIRECPRCGVDSLGFIGAFWCCSRCGYAITGSALAAEPRSTKALRENVASWQHDP